MQSSNKANFLCTWRPIPLDKSEELVPAHAAFQRHEICSGIFDEAEIMRTLLARPILSTCRAQHADPWSRALLVAASLLGGSSGAALAQAAAAPDKQAPAAPASQETAAAKTPAAPASWASTITLGAQLDAGATFNGNRPADGLNFGRLFTDKANTVLLNQVQLTATRPINSGASGYDFGFILQANGGTDARYIHYLGEFTSLSDSRYQLTLLQANFLAHTPWLTSGGIDWKIGQFVTSIGYETIDPSTNPFYSHSYIFNFGPFQHTGALAEWHVNPTVDLYGQVDTGESTTFGTYSGDNNARPAGLVGFGLNNLDGGKLTWLSLAHLGPENPLRTDPQANSQMRYEADGILTYKATSKLTLVTELNFQHDDGFGADSYGGSQYVSYGLTPTITLNGRVEFYRDNAGFFVAAYPGNLDAVHALQGVSNTVFGVGRATYSEYTVGFTYKPSLPHVALLMFRPEIRWDHSLSGTHAYDAQRGISQFTFGGDVVLGF